MPKALIGKPRKPYNPLITVGSVKPFKGFTTFLCVFPLSKSLCLCAPRGVVRSARQAWLVRKLA